MTRKEAINELKQIYDAEDYSVPYETHEALDMAIRSLEAWNEVQYEIANKATLENVDDLVLCMKIIDKHLQEVEE